MDRRLLALAAVVVRAAGSNQPASRPFSYTSLGTLYVRKVEAKGANRAQISNRGVRGIDESVQEES